VGLGQFSEQRAGYITPQAGRRGLSRLLQGLLSPQLSKRQPLQRSLADWPILITRGSRVIVISDGYALAELPDTALKAIAQPCQTSWLRVLDILEWQAPPIGQYGLWQQGQRHLLQLANEQQRSQYSAQLQSYHQKLAQRLQALGIDLMTAFNHQVDLHRISL